MKILSRVMTSGDIVKNYNGCNHKDIDNSVIIVRKAPSMGSIKIISVARVCRIMEKSDDFEQARLSLVNESIAAIL